MTILTTVQKFLIRQNPEKKPFLLALSGGPDSTALHQALLQLKRSDGYPFAIAHVNHRWRQESDLEAEKLQEEAQQLGISFHLKVLQPSALTGNLENACRVERLQFFKALCLEHGYHAVMLGHHAGDQAETVLKRLFETSNLLALKGLEQVVEVENLLLWRPLINLQKKDILAWLETQNATWFDDQSNRDPKFLRGRLREELLPYLSQAFGKQITKNLCLISEEVAELNEFIQTQVQESLSAVKRESEALTLDLRGQTSLFLVKAIIRALCQQEGIFISREQLQLAATSVLSGKGRRQITSGGKRVVIDRNTCKVFFVNVPVPGRKDEL